MLGDGFSENGICRDSRMHWRGQEQAGEAQKPQEMKPSKIEKSSEKIDPKNITF